MSATFEITRTYNAPREIVFKAFSEAEHLRNWWGPRGWEFHIASFAFRRGGVLHYSQKSPEGEMMWVKFEYNEIIVPEKIVYTYYFSDQDGGIARAPFHETWPLKMQNTFLFQEKDGGTVLRMIGTPESAAEAELKTFKDSRDMLQEGFGGTLDDLADYLPKVPIR